MLQNVMLPVSVMGQNAGKLTVLPNQVSNFNAYKHCRFSNRIIVLFLFIIIALFIQITLPCSATVRQPAKVISQPKMAPKQNTDMGKTFFINKYIFFM